MSGIQPGDKIVVDFELGKKVISESLKGTEFENYTRIFDENAG